MRLGRQPHDPDAFAALPSIRRGAMLAPPVLNRTHIAYAPRMFANDTIPDCTAAALANGLLAIGAINGAEPVITDDLVPRFYAACIGHPDADPAALAATDGAVMLDVLHRQLASGFDVGQQVPLVGVFGTLRLSENSLALGMARLGGVYAGVDLWASDMDAFAAGRVPDVSRGGEMVGGHALWLWDYPERIEDGAAVRIATWGAVATVTWGWLLDRVREAYGLFWRQSALATGMDLGVSADALAASLAEMVA